MQVHQAYQGQGWNIYCRFYIENFATCEMFAQTGIISDINILPWEDTKKFRYCLQVLIPAEAEVMY